MSFCSQCGNALTVAQIGPIYVPQTSTAIPDAPAPAQNIAAVVQPVYAGFWLRSVALVIDTIVVSLPLALIGSVYPALFLNYTAARTDSLFWVPQLTPLAIAATIVLEWLYYAACEASSWQATLGKRALKLYVSDLNGQRLTFGRATLRHFAKIISKLTFLAGYFMAGFTQKKQALHDLIAHSLVLRRPQ